MKGYSRVNIFEAMDATDIDNLGAPYIEKIWDTQKSFLSIDFDVSEFAEAPKLKAFKAKYPGKFPDLPISEKREILKGWYTLKAMGERGGLPPFLYINYQYKTAGWTNDIMDKNLLKRVDYYDK